MFSYDLTKFMELRRTKNSHYLGELFVYRDKLTAIAGMNNHNGTVEVFNGVSWSDTEIPALGKVRIIFSSLTLNDTLFVFGGLTCTSCANDGRWAPGYNLWGKWSIIDTVMMYNHNVGSWKESALYFDRYNHRSIVLRGKILHIGGCEDVSYDHD